MRALLCVLLVACGSKGDDKKAPPTPAQDPVSAVDREALLAGRLPEGPESEVINVQCRICHAVEYLTQQRLSEAGWTKTLVKMRSFGANLSESDVPRLAAFAARHWNPELPDRVLVPGPPPAGALP